MTDEQQTPQSEADRRLGVAANAVGWAIWGDPTGSTPVDADLGTVQVTDDQAATARSIAARVVGQLDRYDARTLSPLMAGPAHRRLAEDALNSAHDAMGDELDGEPTPDHDDAIAWAMIAQTHALLAALR